MGGRYRFVDERKFRHFCEGLTFDAADMGVLDACLAGLDEKSGLPSRLVAWSGRNGFSDSGYKPKGPQCIVSLTKRGGAGQGPLSLARAALFHGEQDVSPTLHLELFSPVLQIPQRVEVPLRLVLKGLPDVEGKHTVYLHALRLHSGGARVYYGVSKRGWMLRFNEHMRSALSEESPRLFHRVLRELINARTDALYASQDGVAPAGDLKSMSHVVCMAGLDEEAAFALEEYLVQKHSFGKPQGLNMIPGGRAGMRYLHELRAMPPGVTSATTDEREDALVAYMRANPRKGLPNPAAAQNWEDPDYAARVICGPEGRLGVDQLREIRRLARAGAEVGQIAESVQAKEEQVSRVVAGKTYRRIQ